MIANVNNIINNEHNMHVYLYLACQPVDAARVIYQN